ncbi:MAG: hypothetical protein E7325_06540 [Clostridiales bacterium]|nr:hypothetical protein [Clostridiales bacterium]
MVRAAALILILALTLSGSAGAEIAWKTDTPAQRILKEYITLANQFLTEQGERPVNTLFEIYEKLAVFGITTRDGAEEPEGVEITVQLLYQTPGSLQLRVSDPTRFPVIAAAFLWALDPGQTSPKSALEMPSQKANQVIREPQTSFEETVEELNGTRPRVYYAYYPNQYRDGVSWLQMTIIFPLEGSWGENGAVTVSTATRAPDTYSGNDANYDGYYSQDDYTHYEVFVTETPEPDSAAGEDWSIENP